MTATYLALAEIGKSYFYRHVSLLRRVPGRGGGSTR